MALFAAIGAFIAKHAVALVLTAVSAGASYVEAKKAKKAAKRAADAARGVLLNKESNIEPIPVIYGERRVGGTRVYISTAQGQANQNEYLYICIVWGEGEVESITSLQLDDIPITDSRFTGLYQVQHFLGTDDQTASSLLTQSSSEWTSNHRLRGVAYTALRLTWNEDAFSGIPDVTAIVRGRKVYDPRTETTGWSDNPALCLRDYLLNERFGKGLPLGAIDDAAFAQAATDCDESVTEYTDGTTGKLFTCNYVLQPGDQIFSNVETFLLGMRGFLPYTQGQYSLRIDGSESPDFDFTPNEIIGGIQVRGESKSEKYNRVTVTFPNPDANWQPDVAIWPPAGSTEETEYLAEDGGELLHLEIEFETITSFYQARDLARILLLRSRNALRTQFTSTSEALNLTVGDVCTVTHPTPGWNAKPFQVEEIALNDDGTCQVSLLEYDSTIYTWEVGTQQAQYPDTNLPNPFNVGLVTGLMVTETTAIANDGTLLPALRVNWTPPVDSFVSKYEIQWNAAEGLEDWGSITEEFTENIDYELITDSVTETLDYGLITEAIIDANPENSSAITYTPQFTIIGISPFVNFNIRVRAINDFGVKGGFVSVNGLASGDVTPPSPASNLTAVGGLREITLSWINPSDNDFKNVEIWENNTNNFATATRIAVSGNEFFVRSGLGYDVTRYYWVVAVDYSDNKSAPSSGVSATTLFIDSDAFSQEVMDLFLEAGAFGIEPVASLPLTGDFDGQIKLRTSDYTLWRWDATEEEWTDDIFSVEAGSVTAASFAAGIEPVGVVDTLPSPTGYEGVKVLLLTTDSKLYRYNASVPEFTALISPDDLSDPIPTSALSGTIGATQIADNAVIAQKIAANAVTAGKILAGSVNSDKLAANSVIAGKIAAGAISTSALFVDGVITSNHIQSGTIQGDRIAANQITGGLIAASGVITQVAQINDALITNAKLQNLSVSTGKIQDLAVDTLKIANQAVTIPSSDFAAAQTATIPWDGGAWVTVASVTFTSSGAPVLIAFSFKGILISGTGPLRFRLTGSDSYTEEFGAAFIEIFPGMSIAGNALHTFPSSGSKTINLQVAPNDSLTSVRASHRAITAIEVKK